MDPSSIKAATRSAGLALLAAACLYENPWDPSAGGTGPGTTDRVPEFAGFRETVRWGAGGANDLLIEADTARSPITGLSWQRAAQGDLTWAEAFDACEAIVPAGTWQLPTVAELESLVTYGAPGPAIDAAAFPGTPAAPTWTSTPVFTTSQVWAVDFREGNLVHVPTDERHVARCVRIDRQAPMRRYGVDATRVIDESTGLEWMRQPAADQPKALNAADACSGRTEDGGGWRLPTIRELWSLVKVGAPTPTIDSTAFPDTPSSGFWSSTSFGPNTNRIWFVSFTSGLTKTSWIPDAQTGYVRCVRARTE